MYFSVREVNAFDADGSAYLEVASNIAAVNVGSSGQSPRFRGDMGLQIGKNSADGTSIDARCAEGMAKWADGSDRRASSEALFKGNFLFVDF